MGDSKKNEENKLAIGQLCKPPPNQFRERDTSRLRELFYKGYDPSSFSSFLIDGVDETRLPAGWSFIGEGTHFQSFRVNKCGPTPLVLSVANEQFCAGLASNHSAWAKAMSLLRTLNLPLVPPFEVLHNDAYDAKIAYVTPFGGQHENKASSHWQPLASQVEYLTDGLRKCGLGLDDVAQIRCLDGIPFIIDWSDLIWLHQAQKGSFPR